LGHALRQDARRLGADTLEVDAEALEHAGGDTLALADEAEEEVLGADVVVVKAAGYPFMFLPDALGLIHLTKAEEVIRAPMETGKATVNLARAGAYLVYAADYDVLVSADALGASGKGSWLTVGHPGWAGGSDQTAYLERGLRPYDTLFAEGRPFLTFSSINAGEHILTFPARKANLYVVPDNTTGYELIISLFILLQGGVALVPIAVLFRKWEGKRKERYAELAGLKTIQQEGVWKVGEHMREERMKKRW